MSNHKLTVATCVSRVIQCELILPITAKFISVCTMYIQCTPRQLAWFHHGSWRVCLHRNEYDIWCNVCWETFCSLRSHGTRDKAGSIIDGGYRERVSVEAFCSLRSHGHGKGGCLRLRRMAQLSNLVIWFARNWWMFGATVFCSLRSHGTRLLLTQQSKPCLVMGRAGVCACAVNS